MELCTCKVKSGRTENADENNSLALKDKTCVSRKNSDDLEEE